jgi:hypothetical protein
MPPPVPSDDQPVSSALPSRTARILAFGAILLGGLCGGVIGFSVTRLQCAGECTTNKSLGGLVGAVLGAVGLAIVAVLALRAMGEWKTIQERDAGQAAPNDSRRKPSA